MPKINKKQRRALTMLWLRCQSETENPIGSLREFHRSAYYSYLMGCVMVEWCGMIIGIEENGYIHS
jgi:hypothetical protein